MNKPSQSKQSIISSFIEISKDFYYLYILLAVLWLNFFFRSTILVSFAFLLALILMARELNKHHAEMSKIDLVLVSVGMMIVFLYVAISLLHIIIIGEQISWDIGIAFLELAIGFLILSVTAFWILLKKRQSA